MTKSVFSKFLEKSKSIFTSFYFITGLLVCVVSAGVVYLGATSKVDVLKPYSPKKEITWGVVDNTGVFDDSKEITMQHVFVSWKKNDATEVSQKLNKSIEMGRVPLLTIEPWVEKEDESAIYNKILEGKYDEYLIPICEATSNIKGEVLFRFAHEMDLYASSRYPWSNQAAGNYQLMFRRVVNICRKISKNLKIVWSPGGIGEFLNYYPGDEYVDVIGFSVYSYEEYEMKTTNHTFSFLDLFDSKYDRVKSIKKDIMIAEMGVSGSEEYKVNWLKDALRRIKSPDYQRYLKYVVYLNAKDEKPWVDGIVAPDFSTTKSQFPQI